MGPPPNIELLLKIYSQNHFLPKTKMVRMVHRSMFHEMGLEISDQKKELWAKTEKPTGRKNIKFKINSAKISEKVCFE